MENKFESLRVSTMSVTTPLFEMLRIRADIISRLLAYIETLPDDLAKYEILQQYNDFAMKDITLTAVVKGKIDELPTNR